jgi:hypothetical protein
MKIFSLVVNLLTIVNCILVIFVCIGKLPYWYLCIGIAYVIFHYIYGVITKESIFKYIRK